MSVERFPLPRFAAIAGLVAAGLMAIASLAGLLDPDVYARETPAWRAQALAQDGVDLVVATPWLAIAAVLALRGSRRAVFVLGGGLAYTAYTFVIYAFAVHFNAMFLVYVAALGCSVFALLDLARWFERAHAGAWFDGHEPRRTAGVAMMVAAVAFLALWLSDVIPAIVRGVPPANLAEVGLLTNPVHVLDLAIVLPLLFAAGHLLRRGRDAGYALGGVFLGFAVLMDLAIAVMIVVQLRHGLPGDPVVAAVLTLMAVGFGALLVLLLRALRLGPATA